MNKYTSTLLTAGFLITLGRGNTLVAENKMLTGKHSLGSSLQQLTKPSKTKYDEIIYELDSYLELPNNWDGYNGIQPTQEVVATVKKFLNLINDKQLHTPDIMLSGTGEVALFWKNKDDYIEVSFEDKDQLTYFFTIKDKFYGEDDVYFTEKEPIALYSEIKQLHEKFSSTSTTSIIPKNEKFSNTLIG